MTQKAFKWHGLKSFTSDLENVWGNIIGWKRKLTFSTPYDIIMVYSQIGFCWQGDQSQGKGKLQTMQRSIFKSQLLYENEKVMFFVQYFDQLLYFYACCEFDSKTKYLTAPISRWMILPPTTATRICDWTQHVNKNLKTLLHCHVSRGPLPVTDLPPMQNSAAKCKTYCLVSLNQVSSDHEMMPKLLFSFGLYLEWMVHQQRLSYEVVTLSSSCMCLAGTCLSSCRKWRDLEAAVLRLRREEASCSHSRFHTTSAAFSDFLSPTTPCGRSLNGLGYWRYWLPSPLWSPSDASFSRQVTPS